MLDNLEFSGPSGPAGSPEFNASEIGRLIAEEGEGYWNDGGGGSIVHRDGGKTAILGLTFKDGVGFHLTHGVLSKEARSEVWHYATSSDDYGRSATLQSGGEGREIPLALFVSRAEAHAAVEEFLATAGRAGGVRWIRDDECPRRPGPRDEG